MNAGNNAWGFSNDDAFTFAAWVYFDGNDGHVVSITNERATMSIGTLSVNSGQLGCRMDDGSNGSAVSSGTSFPTSSWTHAAVTFDGLTVRVYQDASEKNSGSDSYATVSADSGFGADPHSPNRSISADIDDVRVYNRALSSGEIDTIYNRYSF
ncbi:MAG: LamG domain-containing protein [Candidatus Nanohaloarchaea archaeon]